MCTRQWPEAACEMCHSRKVTCNLSAGLCGSPISRFKNIIDACLAKGYIIGVGPSKFSYHSSMWVYELLYFTVNIEQATVGKACTSNALESVNTQSK